MLFNKMTDGQIGKISRLLALFSDSVCTLTKSDLGEELGVLTPPLEAFGPCDSVDEFFFTLSNYNNHHALLTDKLVQGGCCLTLPLT